MCYPIFPSKMAHEQVARTSTRCLTSIWKSTFGAVKMQGATRRKLIYSKRMVPKAAQTPDGITTMTADEKKKKQADYQRAYIAYVNSRGGVKGRGADSAGTF